jgi:Sulfotransferase family
MMQILAAGGLVCATDSSRAPDDGNPRGYYELESVKRLSVEDAGFLAREARGKVVKIVHPLLYRLRAPAWADVIMMQRDPTEIVASQSRMLANRGLPDRYPPSELVTLYQRELHHLARWFAGRPDFNVIEIAFAQLISDPESVVRRLVGFLGTNLDVEAMAAVVDPSLYRERVRDPQVSFGDSSR